MIQLYLTLIIRSDCYFSYLHNILSSAFILQGHCVLFVVDLEENMYIVCYIPDSHHRQTDIQRLKLCLTIAFWNSLWSIRFDSIWFDEASIFYRRLTVSPVKNSENFRLNDIFSSSSLLPLSLVLSTSSPKIMVRVYGGDGSLGSRKPGFSMIFGMIPIDSHSSSSVYL